MFQDDEDVLSLDVDPAVAEVLPYFLQLQSTPEQGVLAEIKNLADSGNVYACYVYGIYHIFGKIPRHYAFSRQYPPGEVLQKANIPLNERLGLSYLVKLFKLKGQDIQEFHLEGIYDLQKIVEGSAKLFDGNDLSCRPKTMSDPLYQLFSSGEKIRNLLGRLDHYEAYLDLGVSALQRFEREEKEDDLRMAVDYFQRILVEDPFCRYGQYDLSQANYHMGMLYLYGNSYFPKNIEKGVTHLVAAHCDEAFCELIRYYSQYGDKYVRSIRRCIGLIQDDALRNAQYLQCGLNPPEPVDLMSSIQMLLKSSPVKKQQIDLSVLMEKHPQAQPAAAATAPVEAADGADAVVAMFEMIADEDEQDTTAVIRDEFSEEDELALFDDEDDFAIPDDD